MVEKISKERMDKWVWEPGDIVVNDEVYIPRNLKGIVDNMPKDDRDAYVYLTDKVKDKTITTEEFRFILQVTQ